jgi:hypothetical protein
LKLNETHQLLVYADDNLLEDNIDTMKSNAEALFYARKVVGMEVNRKTDVI